MQLGGQNISETLGPGGGGQNIMYLCSIKVCMTAGFQYNLNEILLDFLLVVCSIESML